MIRVKWNVAGFRRLRSAPGVVGELESITEGWADEANGMGEFDTDTDGFVAYSREGKKVKQGRWQTGVVTKGPHARRANAKHDILLKVMK
ncbi:MAG: hypothetical protein KDB18_12575 [Salinibacterium sp.]|nr:hypothetical protein [Salinibacterium sp.]